MFFECSSLKELNLSNFNTDNVTNMSYMFSGCKLLKELDISNFNVSKVNNMDYMLSNLRLKALKISDSNINKVKQFSGIN